MTSHRTNLSVLALSCAALIPGAANAQSGLLTRPIDVGPLTLSAGAPLAEGPIELEPGKQYSLVIKADGTAELAIVGPEFFRNVWINEVIINDIEVRPLGLDSIEFDAAGEVEMTFVPIRPGTFTLRIPGSTGDSQSVTINVVDRRFAPGAAPPAGGAKADEDDDDEAK